MNFQKDIDVTFSKDTQGLSFYYDVPSFTNPYRIEFYMVWQFEHTEDTIPYLPTTLHFEITASGMTHFLYWDSITCCEILQDVSNGGTFVTKLDYFCSGPLNPDMYNKFSLKMYCNNYGHLKTVTPMIFNIERYNNYTLLEPTNPEVLGYNKNNLMVFDKGIASIGYEEVTPKTGPIVLDLHVPWFYDFEYSTNKPDFLEANFFIEKTIIRDNQLQSSSEINRIKTKVAPDDPQFTHLTWVDEDVDYPEGTRFRYETFMDVISNNGGARTYQPAGFNVCQYPYTNLSDIDLFQMDYSQETFEPIDSVFAKELGKLELTIEKPNPVYLSAVINWTYDPFTQYPGNIESVDYTELTFTLRKQVTSPIQSEVEDLCTYTLDNKRKYLGETSDLRYYDTTIEDHIGHTLEYSLWASCGDSYIKCLSPTIFIGRQVSTQR